MSFCGYDFIVECHEPLMKCNTVDKINVLESSYLESSLLECNIIGKINN
jgi:hypothetical protein